MAVELPSGWIPKTRLGKAVAEGRITDIDQLFQEGINIREPEIIDALLPDLDSELMLIGGTSGKGGGIRRTPTRRTTRIHKSGRRFKTSVMVVVGSRNGYIGIGFAVGPVGKARDVIEKAKRKAKLNVIPVKRGCGSWECRCAGTHSIPIKTEGKCGSVKVELTPAPKGTGLVVNNEVKKMMRLAGIKDVRGKARGQTRSRINFMKAVFEALKKMNTVKLTEEQEKITGSKVGRV